MVNRVILVGNLTKDAESLPSSGKPMTRMRLATNSTWRDAQAYRAQPQCRSRPGALPRATCRSPRGLQWAPGKSPALAGGPSPFGADAPTA
jgi:hypothetical protein